MPRWRNASMASTGRPRKTPSTTASAVPAGRVWARSTARAATPGYLATYALLRKAGNNGVQLPIKRTRRRQAHRHRDALHRWQVRHQGRQGQLQACALERLPKLVADQKAKYKFWINNGRANEVWQTGVPRPVQQLRARSLSDGIHRDQSGRCTGMGVAAGDVVEVFNDFGSTYAMAYPDKAIKPGQTFMLFGGFKASRGTWSPLGGSQRRALLQGHLGQHPARGQRRGLEADHQLQGTALFLNHRLCLLAARDAAFGGACGHPRFRRGRKT